MGCRVKMPFWLPIVKSIVFELKTGGIYMKSIVICLILTGLLTLISCTEKKETGGSVTPSEKTDLFNGRDFTGWVRYIPGDSVDVDKVWQVRDGILHCTGVPKGYIRTESDFFNYRLHVEWRWDEEPGNSGVLLHMQEPDTVWPKAIEAQLKSGNAGDFYVMGGTNINERQDPENRRIPKRTESSELPAGEWNSYDILCSEDTITLIVNDIVQNIATGATVKSGKICLQSEGKPIQFRNIYIEPLR